MRVLITGVSGMVGSHLVDYLLEETDWELWGMVRWRSSQVNIEHLFSESNKQGRLNFIDGDLTDQSSLLRVLQKCNPDYIFHLAAQSYPTTSFTSPQQTFYTNINGTLKILDSIRLLQLDPIIHICSSSEVYGRVSKEDLPITENSPFKPASPYSISKVGADLLSKFYFEAYGMKTLTTRMFSHTGPRRGEVFAESSFAKQIAMAEIGAQPPKVRVGNLNSLRTWADVRDAVRAYYMLVTINPVFGETYNIGGQNVATVGEMLNKLISFSTLSNIEIEEVADRIRPLDADLQIPDTKKFSEHTGWAPRISFDKTLQDLLDYWRVRVKKENFRVDL